MDSSLIIGQIGNAASASNRSTLITVLYAIAFDPRILHLLNDGRLDDQTAKRRNGRHVQPGKPMHGLDEDSQVG